MKKKGFTLVELLAVIVILAVILVIAVPKIMDTIQNSKEGTLMSSAKLIASQAEKKYVENQVLGINDVISCDDVAKTTDDYDYCNISFDSDGKASVTISGNGKFEGMAICGGTKTEASISDNCYTDEACFAYENGGITDFDIDKDACKESAIADGTPAEDAEVMCSGGTLSDGYNLRENIEAAIADGSSEAMEFVNYLIDEEVIINVVYGDGIEITGYAYEDSACGSDVWVPDTIDNKTVVGIGSYAFTRRGVYPERNPVSNNKKEYSIMPLKNNLYNVEVTPILAAPDYNIGITSIKLPSTIEYIGEGAFKDNEITGELDFSNLINLKSIGSNAFGGGLFTSVILPSSVTSIGEGAFYTDYYDYDKDGYANRLTKVYVGNPNAYIGCDAFGWRDDIKTHNLPETYGDNCGVSE